MKEHLKPKLCEADVELANDNPYSYVCSRILVLEGHVRNILLVSDEYYTFPDYSDHDFTEDPDLHNSTEYAPRFFMDDLRDRFSDDLDHHHFTAESET